jgi:hypothetical protein
LIVAKAVKFIVASYDKYVMDDVATFEDAFADALVAAKVAEPVKVEKKA